MKQILIILSIALPSVVLAQTSATSNTLTATGVTAIQSTANAGYKLSIGGAVKQFGTGLNLVGSPTLFLHNTTVTTGRQYGINAGNDGLFQVFDVTGANAVRFAINGLGNIGIGTAAPNNKLEIDNTTAGTSGLRFTRLTSSSTASVGNGKVLTVDANGNVIMVNESTANSLSWLFGGNTVGALKTLGTVDNFDLPFITNNVERLRISAAGNLMIGTNVDNTAKLQVNGNVTQLSGTHSFANGLLFDTYPVFPAARIFSGGSIVYQSNSAGNQHYFLNQIGSSFTGNLVTIDPGAYPNLSDQQLTLKVLGKNGAIGLNVNMLGNVGVGTTTPTEKLEVNGNIKSSGLVIPTGAAAGKVLTSDANGNASWQPATGGGSSNWSVSGNNIYNANSGVVIIGKLPSAALTDVNLKLAVNGNISAQKLKITQSGWADYVFDPAYKLRTLKDVEIFIQKNNHLPEIPSATEVEKQGIDVGDNQAALLKKVEELTLYIIDLNKRIELLEKEKKTSGATK